MADRSANQSDPHRGCGPGRRGSFLWLRALDRLGTVFLGGRADSAIRRAGMVRWPSRSAVQWRIGFQSGGIALEQYGRDQGGRPADELFHDVNLYGAVVQRTLKRHAFAGSGGILNQDTAPAERLRA